MRRWSFAAALAASLFVVMSYSVHYWPDLGPLMGYQYTDHGINTSHDPGVTGSVMLAAEPAAIAWSALPTPFIGAVASWRQRFFQADPMGRVDLAAAEPAFPDSDIQIEVPDVPGDLTAMIVETMDRQIADVGPLAPEHFLDANPDELNRMIAANLEAAGDFATGSVKPKPKPKSRSARAGGRKTPAPVPAPEPDFWSRLADLFTPRTT